MRDLFPAVWRVIKGGKAPHRGAAQKPVMPTCVWLVGEDPVNGPKRISCKGFEVWFVGNTICPFCQKHIEWRKDDTAS